MRKVLLLVLFLAGCGPSPESVDKFNRVIDKCESKPVFTITIAEGAHESYSVSCEMSPANAKLIPR